VFRSQQISRRDVLRGGAAAGLLAPAAGWTGCAGLPTDASLPAQRGRARRLLELALAGGDAVYDDARGLCVDAEIALDPRTAAKYKGSWVAWYSPNYAWALLASGRDPARAERIIGAILDAQETDPARPARGNFRAIAEWSEVRDANAVVFIVNELGPAWIDHRERLSPALRERLRAAFALAAEAVSHRKADWFYSNIALLRLSSQYLLARILEDSGLAATADAAWETWRRETVRNHLTESNSPNYYFHQIAPLLAIRAHAPAPDVRAQAGAATEHLLLLLAANYHSPSRMLAGTACRAYLESTLLGRGGFHLLMHQFFGGPLRLRLDTPQEKAEMLEATSIVRYPFAPPPAAADLALRKRHPFTLKARYGSWFGKDQGPWDPPSIVTCTNHQTEAFSLSTQYGVWMHYAHECPLLITRAGEGPGRNVFLHGAERFTMVDSWIRQSGGRAVGALFWPRPVEGQIDVWWKSGPPYRVAHRLHLGRRDDMTDLTFLRLASPPPEEFRPDDFHLRAAWKDGLALDIRSIPLPPCGWPRRTGSRAWTSSIRTRRRGRHSWPPVPRCWRWTSACGRRTTRARRLRCGPPSRPGTGRCRRTVCRTRSCPSTTRRVRSWRAATPRRSGRRCWKAPACGLMRMTWREGWAWPDPPIQAHRGRSSPRVTRIDVITYKFVTRGKMAVFED
jgi:hypothetical protein